MVIAMATTTSSSLSNFFSLFTSSKPPLQQSISIPQPSQLPLKEKRTPIIQTNELSLSTSYSPDVMSVVCPSLAYANTLFFRSAYNVQVIVDDNEHEEKLIGRFRREVMRAGIIQECKRRRYFENKQEERKRRVRDAAKRNRRRRPFTRGPPEKTEASASKRDDDKDNWDLPAGGIP